MTAGTELRLVRDGDESQLTDELIGLVCERVRPHGPDGHGAGWELLRENHERLVGGLVDEHLTVVKTHELLAREGVMVAQRTCTVTRWRCSVSARSARGSTVPVADGEPGLELPVDFGKMGLIFDPAADGAVCAGP